MTMQAPTLPRETRQPHETRRQALEVEKKQVREEKPLWRERIQQESGE